ncbi:probable serine/threonine-protein kinase At1g54610 [Musa acuminata AAA Group]|uniref:probable serine/threonine-protein kinase At1g54610 n=1 Tax=Musa acuminata AAA Group TaxID=214697 RepID=UPI0031E394F2
MGCIQAKGPSMDSPLGESHLNVMMHENDYFPVRRDDDKRQPLVIRPPPGRGAHGTVVMCEEESEGKAVVPENTLLPPTQLVKPVVGDADELVDGWPRWLVNNVPPEMLAGLIPKSADSYEKLDKVGQGTYSNVYKARDRDTGKIVALKKVRFDTSESESVKFMAREIMILQKLDHPNVIKLEGLATSRMHYSLYLVFDYMRSDLARVISRSDARLTEPQVKCYMRQILSGLQHCHERGILHRDIKGSNLLIDKNGVLKIADFGLANFYNPNKKCSLTSRVVTLWYRAPELLLGTTDYGVGIDLWSAGCLLAEMFVGKPIMPGRNEVEQLYKIFKLCGSPSEDYWRKLKLATIFQPPPPYKPSIVETFGDFSSSALSLLMVLLALDPSNRGTAASALQSDFFSTRPSACDLSDLPVMYKEADEPIQSYERRKRNASSKQQSRRQRDGERKLVTVNTKSDSGSSKEEKPTDLLTDSQEPGSSTGSSSSSIKAEGSTPIQRESQRTRLPYSPYV